MAKQSKRQRKFQASGGVKKRLEKGTIAKKGKLKKRKRNDDNDKVSDADVILSTTKKDRSDDFASTSSKNLASLDLDSFFSQVSDAIENADGQVVDEKEESEEPKKTAKSQEPKGTTSTKQQEKGEDESDSSDSDSDSGSSDDSSEDEKEDDGTPPAQKKAKASKTSSSSSDDESEDSDDEDLEAAEKRMKAQMAKLTQSDPEFHEFLQENESSLLDFGEDEDGAEDQDSDDDDARRKKGVHSSVELTFKELKKLEEGSFKSKGLKQLKKLMAAYRSACHLADSSDDGPGSRPGESGIQYIIDSSKVFDKLMVLCLSRCHQIFRFHLFEKEANENDESKKEADDEEIVDVNKPIDPRKFERSERWADMRRILQSFFSSTLHIMTEAKEPELLTFVLKALSNYVPMMSPFPRVAEAMLKCFVDKWSASLDSSEDYQVVRLNAFFRIRQLAKTQPFPFIESCLRRTYLAYARRSKHGKSAPTIEELSTLTFMGNSVVELYSLDLHSSYQHAFVYIRQLALHLRTAIQKSTPESHQQLFRWQYMHCLKVWVAVLSDLVSSEDGAQMRSLIYPLSEVINGVARLAPSNGRHLPYRLHCVRLLQQLAAASETYMPTTSLLLECLDWKEWYLKPKKTAKKGTTAGLDMLHILKLPKDDSLRTHEQLEAGITELFVLLEREVDLYIYTPAFPEYSIWIRRRLKSFNRETRQQRWRRFSEGIIETCEKYAKAAIQKRSKLNEAPKDVQNLECLRPVSSPSIAERHKSAIDKEAKRLVSAAPPKAAAKGDSKLQDNDESDDEMAEQAPPPKKARKGGKAASAKKTTTKAAGYNDPEVLEQEDDVQEGINWSDEEE